MPAAHQVIHIHPEAPTKPPEGAPCNGCGVCCLAEPCPVGMLVSRKRHGACVLLRWSDAKRDHYDGKWRNLLKLAESWKKPELPIDGRDVMAKGIDEGPKIGTTLRALEEEWIEADFAPDRRALLRRLKETINQPRK